MSFTTAESSSIFSAKSIPMKTGQKESRGSCPCAGPLSGGNASVHLRESSKRDPTHKQSPCQSPCQSVSQSVSKREGRSTIQLTTYPANHLLPSYPPVLYSPNSSFSANPVSPPLTDAWWICRSGRPPSPSGHGALHSATANYF